MRITLAQAECRLGDIDANVERASEVLDEAKRAASDLIVFPELYLSGYSVEKVHDDTAVRATDERLLTLAKRADNAGVVMGFAEAGPRGMHTYSSAAYYEAGELVHVHRKLYLPNYADFEERKHFSPGQSMRAFPSGIHEDERMAILVCNDAWQPQLAFLATQDGARVLIVPAASAQSNFPQRYDSYSYWRDITTFYGRMFQVFVVFVNRVGAEEQLRFWGGSHVVDPWGNVIAEAAANEEAVLTVEIDVDDVRRRRRDIPLVKEARLGLLHREIERLLNEGGDL